MNEQQILKEKLEKAVAYARRHKNVITDDNFCAIMGDLAADEGRRNLIIAYLKEKHIRVLTEVEEPEETVSYDMDLDEEDHTAIDIYYEELKRLPILTDREKERITKKAVEGDAAAKEKLIKMFLPEVIDLAKLYKGHDIPMEDLIGEGNIALMIGVSMLESMESADEVEGFIGKTIIDALEALVNEENDEEKLIVKLGQQLKKAAPDQELIMEAYEQAEEDF